MRTTLTLLTTLLLTLTLSATATAQDEVVSFDPGHGLTPLRFGMTQAELGKFGYPVKPGFTDRVLEVGPYTVWLDASGAVETIAVDATKVDFLVHAGAKSARAPRVDLKKASLEDIAAFVGGCGPFQMNEGANVIACERGITLLQSMAGIELRITNEPETIPQRCDGYVTPGATGSATKAVDVKPGKTYCVGTRTLTSGVHPDDITSLTGVLRYNTCPRTEKKGSITIQCDYDGVRFVFGGADGGLRRIEAVQRKE